MNIYNAEQIRAWDAYTITHEPIASVDLMERAAQQCVQWLLNKHFAISPIKIFCGKGNNGGDGLAIARLLLQQGITVHIYILESCRLGSEDFQTNLQRLHEVTPHINLIQSAANFPPIASNDIIVDALFGSGLNKPLKELSADLVNHINNADATVIAIDVPSGLYMNQSSLANTVVEADYTLTFQCYKLALLVAENAKFFGEVSVLNIGLHNEYLHQTPSKEQLVDTTIISHIFQPRQAFAHKGTYGHALLIAGSYGKMGAAILSTKSCLHTGVGLLTSYIPKCGYTIMQTGAYEAMTVTDDTEEIITTLPVGLEKYNAVGVGPGIGTDEKTKTVIQQLIARYKKPLVIDADALNCLASQKELLFQLPPHSILTPHPKEFERLFGTYDNEFDRIAAAQKKAQELQIIIVLKGHHTLIALPDGTSYFNNTGNAGMSKGGSGDILTGIITSLTAQGYPPGDAAVFGVHMHGLAGDLAAHALSQETMIASDIITFLSQAFVQINKDYKDRKLYQ